MERIIEIIETEHREWFTGGDRVKGCIYDIKYDEERQMYITQLKYSWNKEVKPC